MSDSPNKLGDSQGAKDEPSSVPTAEIAENTEDFACSAPGDSAVDAHVSTVIPFGAAGSNRGADGRFVKGNTAAIFTGARSRAFWSAAAVARRELVDGVLTDCGHTRADAPRTLMTAAETLAEATLLRESAFLRVIEAGGPLSAADRARRAFVVWTAAADRVERLCRLIGLRRVPAPTESLDDFLRRREQRDADRRGDHGGSD